MKGGGTRKETLVRRAAGHVRRAIAVVALTAGLAGAAAAETPPGARCQPDALQASGALYRICMPADLAQWNGDLFIYAHGYVSPFAPLAIPEDQLDLGGVSLPDLITGLGYAFITTSYAKNGLAIVEGIADVVDLVSVFATEIGNPLRVYLAGPSEGGAVTALAIEQYPFVFDGGLSACGPVGNFRAQINYFGDFRVLFDYFFPGLLPGTAVDIPPQLIENWASEYVPKIAEAVAANPAATDQLLRVARAPVDEGDPESRLATILDVLWYNVFATGDARAQLGGQPFDNSSRWYRGSGNDLLLNLKVKRFSADSKALATIAAKYETRGDLAVPLVTLHTTQDPVIRYWHQPLYRLKIARNGNGRRHVNLPIVRYGHCQFTAAEALAAFAILVSKVTGEDTRHFTDALEPR